MPTLLQYKLASGRKLTFDSRPFVGARKQQINNQRRLVLVLGGGSARARARRYVVS